MPAYFLRSTAYPVLVVVVTTVSMSPRAFSRSIRGARASISPTLTAWIQIRFLPSAGGGRFF